MRKRIINKKVRNDIYIKLWKRSMSEHMRNAVRLDTLAWCRNYPFEPEDRYSSLSEL